MATVQANKTFTDGLAFDANPINTNFTALKNFANNQLMQLDGSQDFSGTLNMGANKISGLATPTASGDLATKGYADDLVVLPTNTWTQAAEVVDFWGVASSVSYYQAPYSDPTAVNTTLGSDVTLTGGNYSTNAAPYLTFAAPGRYAVEITVQSSGGNYFWLEPFYSDGFTLSVTLPSGYSHPSFINANTYPGLEQTSYIRIGGSTAYGAELLGILDVYASGWVLTFSPKTTTSTANYTGTVKVYKIGDI